MAKFEARLYGHSTAGFEIPQLIVYADTPEELAGALRGLTANGITPDKPDPSEMTGEKTETITCVVKRLHISKSNQETPVVDLYPSWQGEYGQFRFVGLYLNTPEQVAEFEAHSGLRLADMPVYESQAPLQRSASRRHKAETNCTPFVVRKLPDGVKEIDGKSQTVFKFAGYAETTPSNGSQPAQQQSAGNNTTPKPPVWWKYVIDTAKLLPHFGGQPKHVINALNQMIGAGEIMESWAASEVIAAVKAKYDAPGAFDDADEAPAREFDDIPF